jgi:RHS repeat-associated protein
MSYAYNLAGALTSQTYPSGRVVTNTFDADGQLANVSSKSNPTATPRTYANSFIYNAAGAIQSMRLGNGRFESTVFNSRLQPTQIALGTSASNTSLLKLDYDYGSTDNNGNVKSQIITVPNMTYPLIQTYSYDSLNRLTSAEEKSNNITQWKQTFNFDRYGNRNFDEANTTTLPKNCGTPQAPEVCPEDRNRLNPSINTSDNRFSTGQGYDYDSSGNVTKDATDKRFIYDAENKQKSFGTNIEANNGGLYYYDGDGQRVKKFVAATNETTIFVYNAAGQLVAEYSTTAVQNPTISYLTTDTLGSPRINTDAKGQVTARHDYMPFGEEIIGLGNRTSTNGYQADDIRQKFTQKERDTETGLDYSINRYYSSTQGRFTSVDPKNAGADENDPQTWHGYAYALNNPLLYGDPDGLSVKVCDTQGQCAVISDDEANDGLLNKDWQRKNGHTVKGGKVYQNGEVIGTYEILDIDGAPFSRALPEVGRYPIGKATAIGLIGSAAVGAIIGAAVAAPAAATYVVVRIGKEAWRYVNPLRPLKKMGHAAKHLKDFQKYDPHLTEEAVAKILTYVKQTGTQVGTGGQGEKLIEKAVEIGGKMVNVRVVVSSSGNIKSGYIP